MGAPIDTDFNGTLQRYEVPLRGSTATIKVHKHVGGALPGTDPTYNCHGYTFGGREVPGGPFLINPDQVPTILKAGYNLIANERDVKPGDIAVFWLGAKAAHSAVVKEVKHTPGGTLDPSGTTFNEER